MFPYLHQVCDRSRACSQVPRTTLLLLTYKIKYSVLKGSELRMIGYYRTGEDDRIPSLYMMTNRI